MPTDLLEKIRSAGVVGAGGASFPAHIKLSGKADTMIVNASECEPLLHTDKTALLHHTEEIIQGLLIAMRLVGASRGIVAVKAKNEDLIAGLGTAVKKYLNIKVHALEDYYPAGDEQTLVYETTKRIVPEGGLPPHTGAMVHNVVTLLNVFRADQDIPVTERILTVHGEVNEPCVLRAPIGTSYRDLIEYAGGCRVKDPVVLDGGPMMGELKSNLDDSVTKGCSGIIVLDRDHILVKKKTVDYGIEVLRAKSVCDQCSLCTDMCPRYLLGHNLYPHKVMRAIGYERALPIEDVTQAYLCCFCNICSLYACPTMISPAAHLKRLKESLIKNGVKNPHNVKPAQVREFLEARKIASKMLAQKLGLCEYEKTAPKVKRVLASPDTVAVKLKQHPGKPAVPSVRAGAKVKKGDLIGTVDRHDFAAPVHASISGTIESIDSEKIVIKR